VTYAAAKSGGTYVVTYGAIIYGAIETLRGLGRWWPQRGVRPFPWIGAAIAVLVPVVLGSLLFSKAQRRSASPALAEQRPEAASEEDEVTQLARTLNDTGLEPTQRCRAATLLRSKARDRAKSLLVAALSDAVTSVRICAAKDLVSLGELEVATDFYLGNLFSGDDELRRHSIIGVGEVGPRAAAALPALLELIESEHESDRLLAVSAIGDLGHAADSALPRIAELIKTGDPAMRTRAMAAMSTIRNAPY
jgi:hypothetical protein